MLSVICGLDSEIAINFYSRLLPWQNCHKELTLICKWTAGYKNVSRKFGEMAHFYFPEELKIDS